MATYNGTTGNDTYIGTATDDTINGLGGDDNLSGGGGNDTIDGGLGADTLSGGTGNDLIRIDRGDNVHGDDGDDDLRFVTADSSGPATYVYGDIGTDKLRVDMSAVTDIITSYNYNDGSGYIGGISYSGIEALLITGGSASDTLIAGFGNDTITGGAGNDRLVGGLGQNTIDGGTGDDIGLIDLSASNTNRSIAFTSGVLLSISGNKLSNIEGLGVVTGNGSDVVNVANETIGSEIYSMGGADTLTGGIAADILDGGSGDDTIYFGRGDSAHGQTGNDQFFFVTDEVAGPAAYVYGEGDNDTLSLDFSAVTDPISSYNYDDGSGYVGGVSFSGIESLLITGTTASDVLIGGLGNDSINGGSGNDRLDGHAGNNTIDGGAGRDIGLVDVSGSGANQTVTFVSGVALAVAGNNLSTIEGLGLKTGSGLDVIDVSGETIGSEIYTNGGADQITGGAAADYIDGGDGADIVIGGRGDTIHGGNGDDDLRVISSNSGGPATYVYGEGDTDTLTADFSGAADIITSYNYNDGSGYVGGISYSGIEKLVITGGNASDTLIGGFGDDAILGGTGRDRLDGGMGINTIDGGAGKDIGLVDLSATAAGLNVTFHNNSANSIGGNTLNHIEGLGLRAGTGNDTINVSAETIGSEIYGGDGKDTLTGGSSGDILDGGTNDDIVNGGVGDTVHGGDGNDDLRFSTNGPIATTYFYGDAGTDKLTFNFTGVTSNITSYSYNDGSGYMGGVSYSGMDTLVVTGGSGNDQLTGNFGDDRFTGGVGGDTISGGPGNDRFIYTALNESTVGAAGRDTIGDFTSGDKFDLKALETAVGAAFTFIDTAAFSGTAGEIRYAAAGPDTLISIDTDGNGSADFSILATGAHTFVSGDFIL
jgi:Ca2+-binding RTX toxin-like protein